MNEICIKMQIVSFIILGIWLLSLYLFWLFKEKLSKNIENQSRFFLAYTLISAIILIITQGENLFITTDYKSNLTTEIIGIVITVFLIDRIYNYIITKNEQLYRSISLRVCRMPIYTYCANWFFIYEPNNNVQLSEELSKYENLSDFFKSDDFYYKVVSYDFNGLIAVDKTYAQYYNEKMQDVADKFQNILAKYASKLSHKDIHLLEHFGGRAYFFSIFAVMKFISDAKFTVIKQNVTTTVMLFNNSFKTVDRENFNKHFDKLIELINAYNEVVENDFEKWTIQNISKLNTTETANKNPSIEW
jgi:hypothetical protein